jgi:hypothetical protein
MRISPARKCSLDLYLGIPANVATMFKAHVVIFRANEILGMTLVVMVTKKGP